jgi:type IV pilus assembly protein PilO
MKKLNIPIQAIEPYIEAIERLTKIQRLLISLGTIVLVLGAFIYLSFLPKYKEINVLTKNCNELKRQLDVTKKEASQIGKYRKIMKDTEIEFQLVKKALPESKEIPALLASISQSGHDSGMDFLLFQPENETEKDFFAEIPVSIKVAGGYHNFAVFLSKIAGLPRVVNVRDLQLMPEKENDILNTSCTAVTYRFVEKPLTEQKTEEKPKKK